MEVENVFFAITNNNNKVPFVDPVPSSSEPLKNGSTSAPAAVIATKKTTVAKKSVASPRIPLATRPVSAPATTVVRCTATTTTTIVPKVRPPPLVKRQETTPVVETKQTVQQRRIDEIRVIKEKAQQDAEKRKKENQIRKEWENKQKQQEREMLQAFVSDRGHAAAEAERFKKERRKHSVLMNTDMMRKNREKHTALEAAKKQDEKNLLQSRREDFLKLTELRKEEEQQRRESLANRSMTMIQQREVTQQTHHLNEYSIVVPPTYLLTHSLQLIRLSIIWHRQNSRKKFAYFRYTLHIQSLLTHHNTLSHTFSNTHPRTHVNTYSCLPSSDFTYLFRLDEKIS